MEEELSVATSSSLSLLAALYSPPAAAVADAHLAAQIPILWPFMSHSLTSVRLAAATCLACVVTAKDATGWAAAAAAAVAAGGGDADAAADAAAAALAATGGSSQAPQEPGAWLQHVVGPCLRLVLQSLVLERSEAVRQMLLQAWRALLQHGRAVDVSAGLSVRDMRAMLTLLCTPCGQALDAAALVVPVQGRLVPWSSQEAADAGLASRPAKRARSSEPSSSSRSMNGSAFASQGSSGAAAVPAGGDVSGCGVDPEGWPGASDTTAAVHTRMLASRAVAELCDKLTGQVRQSIKSCTGTRWIWGVAHGIVMKSLALCSSWQCHIGQCMCS
jgi:hypothetical protein